MYGAEDNVKDPTDILLGLTQDGKSGHLGSKGVVSAKEIRMTNKLAFVQFKANCVLDEIFGSQVYLMELRSNNIF